MAEPLTLDLGSGDRVSALWSCPDDAVAAYVFAHGAGAGMHHAFMTHMATALAARRVATLRFQFPFMENGSKRPDPPALAHKTVRSAVAEARRRAPNLPLFAGGKSFGGRMTSQALAAGQLTGLCGLVFLGFPLHPAGKPSVVRADHLASVGIPMLFVQGTRDALADLALLTPVVEQLGSRTNLHIIEDADHAFHVRKKIIGRSDAEVVQGIADVVATWCVNARPS